MRELQQTCVVSGLKVVFERVPRFLGHTDRRHRMQVNGLDRHLDVRQRRLVHEVPIFRRQVTLGGAPRSRATSHDGRPQLLLNELFTAVHSPHLVVVVQLRKAGAEKSAVLRHDDDDRARRRDTDDVGG